jgi:hypothetical protein
VNWADTSRQRAVVNLGGGPRPTPKTPTSVPVYLHDWFGPGRTALVVSVKSGDFKAAPDKFRKEAPLTGDESRVAEVANVPFPQPTAPVDDLPPATVITGVTRSGSTVTVRGVASDNGTIKSIAVNGTAAKATAANFAEWQVVLENVPVGAKLEAVAADAAGNVEKTPAMVTVR